MEKFLFFGLSLIFSSFFINDADASIEDQAVDYFKNGTESIFSSLTKDINLDNENFLNTTDEESKNLQGSGKNLFFSFIDLFKNVKNFAKDAVLFVSPYQVNAFVVTLIAVGFSVLFILSILKKIGKHLFVLLLVGLGIILLFVIAGWNS